jgi:hypothetical protein
MFELIHLMLVKIVPMFWLDFIRVSLQTVPRMEVVMTIKSVHVPSDICVEAVIIDLYHVVLVIIRHQQHRIRM